MTKIAAPAGRRGKPKLGQHFLVDTAAPMRIVEALGDISQSTVLEIGPGRGVLTSLLAKRARRLIAIEIDRVLAAQLRMNFSQETNVEIIEGDVLAIDFWGIGMPATATLMQPFYRAASGGRFRIGSVSSLLVGENVLSSDSASRSIETIMAGVHSHAMVTTLWQSWR